MYGAIIGDIVGSVYEFNNIKTKDFPLFSRGCSFTDDTVMTVAVAAALLDGKKRGISLADALTDRMQSFGRAYPNAGYGGRFIGWVFSEQPAPYNSFGNGSAMRVSPAALIARSLEEAVLLARASSEVTHNYPEGIKGAEAAAAAIYLAREGKSIAEIKDYICKNYYNIDFTLDSVRATYTFNATCQRTVPEALEAFFESTDYEDAVRNAVSIGGDSDTLAAIAGAVAWSYYGRDGLTEKMLELKNRARLLLTEDLLCVIDEFDEFTA